MRRSAVAGGTLKSPTIKGWCPGAYRPMASGDGLVVRVRPWLGQITAAQARALCDVARRFGSGTLELTSRANLQIRGVAEPDHAAVIDALLAADLLDADPATEARRNIIMTPDWRMGDDTHRLAQDLIAALPSLPDVPAKFGYAIDTGTAPWLCDAPADIRLERDQMGGFLVVADGAAKGRAVTQDTAVAAVRELLEWFVKTGGAKAGRMARHLCQTPLPEVWQDTQRRSYAPVPTNLGTLMGVPFGQLETHALIEFLDKNRSAALRILTGRRILAVDVASDISDGFCAPDDPLLNVHACTGAPGCPQAHGPTRQLARALAAQLPRGETLHVSGCAKGCAHPRKADHTLIAAPNGFDLVTDGSPWDAPIKRGLTAPTFKDIQT